MTTQVSCASQGRPCAGVSYSGGLAKAARAGPTAGDDPGVVMPYRQAEADGRAATVNYLQEEQQ